MNVKRSVSGDQFKEANTQRPPINWVTVAGFAINGTTVHLGCCIFPFPSAVQEKEYEDDEMKPRVNNNKQSFYC
jgi:hypothetical protein